MLTAFFGFMRISEFTSARAKSFNSQDTLCIPDIKQSDDLSYLIHIKASKTDPFRSGVHIRLAPNNTTLCPVQAMRSYLLVHKTNTGPVFTFTSGHYFTRQSFSRVLQELKPDNPNISSHSFRIGAATTAANMGFPRWLIKSLGRWNSDCFREYIRIPKETISHVSRSIVLHTGDYTSFDPDLA